MPEDLRVGMSWHGGEGDLSKTDLARSWKWILVPLAAYVSGIVVVANAGSQLMRFQPIHVVPLDRLSLESLLGIHIQPPLFSTLSFLVQPIEEHWVVVLVLALFGSATIVICFRALLAVTQSLYPSVVLATAIALSPPLILYSFWWFYTLPVALLLVAFVYFGVKWAKDRGILCLSGAAACLTTLYFTRSSVTIVVITVWLVLTVTLLARDRASRQRRLLSIAIVVAICSPTYLHGIHHLAVFGTNGSSSWVGQNIMRLPFYAGTVQELNALARDDCESRLLQVGPFADPREYPECLRDVDLTASDQTRDLARKTNSSVNTDLHLEISNRWTAFAVYAVVREPGSFAAAYVPRLEPAQRGSLIQFFWSNVEYEILSPVTKPLGFPARVWGWVFMLVGPFAFFGLALVFAIGARDFFRSGEARSNYRRYFPMVSVFICLTATAVFLEVGENERFRAELTPSVIVLGAVAIPYARRVLSHRAWRAGQ